MHLLTDGRKPRVHLLAQRHIALIHLTPQGIPFRREAIVKLEAQGRDFLRQFPFEPFSSELRHFSDHKMPPLFRGGPTSDDDDGTGGHSTAIVESARPGQC